MVTGLYASCLGIVLIALSFNVIRYRRRNRVALGESSDFDLTRAIRAHGNFVEYAPIFLVMLAIAEFQNLPAYAIHALGILFVTGRLAHAYSVIKHERYMDGVIQHNPTWRMVGMICTFNVLGILSIILLIQLLSNIFAS